MTNKEAAEYIKTHCNPDMTQKTQWEIAMVMAIKALFGQQKGDIKEAVKYIKSTQEYLIDIGETWHADYLGDAIRLLVVEGEKDERG